MGQIKNIKLHIVTDIKKNKPTMSEEATSTEQPQPQKPPQPPQQQPPQQQQPQKQQSVNMFDFEFPTNEKSNAFMANLMKNIKLEEKFADCEDSDEDEDTDDDSDSDIEEVSEWEEDGEYEDEKEVKDEKGDAKGTNSLSTAATSAAACVEGVKEDSGVVVNSTSGSSEAAAVRKNGT